MQSLFVPLLVGCAVALLSALGVVLARRPIYAAMALLVHSLSLAALFGILSASMVAVGQVIIYSGAIVVLFLSTQGWSPDAQLHFHGLVSSQGNVALPGTRGAQSGCSTG